MGGIINNWIAQLNEINGIAVDGEVSILKSVLSEVPQGSVLWPILLEWTTSLDTSSRTLYWNGQLGWRPALGLYL